MKAPVLTLILNLVREQTLSRVIRRNTAIGDELSENVFLVDDAGPAPEPPRPPRRRR